MTADRQTTTREEGRAMNPPSDRLSEFRAEYLDYIEGCRDAPPTSDGLTGTERRAAEAFIESHTSAAGIDPYASRPPTDQLLASIKGARRDTSTASAAANAVRRIRCAIRIVRLIRKVRRRRRPPPVVRPAVDRLRRPPRRPNRLHRCSQ